MPRSRQPREPGPFLSLLTLSLVLCVLGVVMAVILMVEFVILGPPPKDKTGRFLWANHAFAAARALVANLPALTAVVLLLCHWPDDWLRQSAWVFVALLLVSPLVLAAAQWLRALKPAQTDRAYFWLNTCVFLGVFVSMSATVGMVVWSVNTFLS